MQIAYIVFSVALNYQITLKYRKLFIGVLPDILSEKCYYGLRMLMEICFFFLMFCMVTFVNKNKNYDWHYVLRSVCVNTTYCRKYALYPTINHLSVQRKNEKNLRNVNLISIITDDLICRMQNFITICGYLQSILAWVTAIVFGQ